jgi:hypothetical protein
MPTAAPIDEFYQAAKHKFAYISKHMSDFGGWKLGNSLDTMIDYLVVAIAHGAVDAKDAESFGTDVSALCNSWIYPGNPTWTWFDDFGWFVISTDRASRQSFFGKPNPFSGFSEECWKRFSERAPYTWVRHEPGTFNDYGPAVDRGVWNTYWQGTSDSYPGDKEGIPSAGALAGIQNTVTNALYLIGAQRRGDTDAAADEWSFLNAWFSVQQQPNLWWPQKNDGALVRERVSRVASGKTNPGFQEDWAWTGDQGLILGGLVGRIAKGEDAANARTQAKELLTGVRLSLVDAHGVLGPCTATGTPPHAAGGKPDIGDYSTGTGVFWRYLLQAWNLKDPELCDFLAFADFKSFVETNAKAAMADPTTSQISISGATLPDTLSNQIAALVAGIVMLS